MPSLLMAPQPISPGDAITLPLNTYQPGQPGGRAAVPASLPCHPGHCREVPGDDHGRARAFGAAAALSKLTSTLGNGAPPRQRTHRGPDDSRQVRLRLAGFAI